MHDLLQNPKVGAVVASSTVSAHWWHIGGWGDVAALAGAVLSLVLIVANIPTMFRNWSEWRNRR
jgi:hypothetical protein